MIAGGFPKARCSAVAALSRGISSGRNLAKQGAGTKGKTRLRPASRSTHIAGAFMSRPTRFPHVPGSKDIEGSVSEDNARSMAQRGSDKHLRGRALAYVSESGPVTADAVALFLKHDHSTVRPRLGELAAMGLVYALEETGKGRNGGKAILWAATPPDRVQEMADRRKARWLEREKKRFARLLAALGLAEPGGAQ